MIEVIEAEAPTEDVPAFGTPEEAIEYAKGLTINASLEGVDISDCVGSIIELVDWTDDAFRLHLANGKVLHLGLRAGKVDLAVQEKAPPPNLHQDPMGASVLVRLGGLEFAWRRGALLCDLCGHEFSRLQLSNGNMCNFLYVKDIGILHLSVLIDCRSQRPFLFWSPSD